jgi:predicted enzyme related to lactoylglutathione lyase
VAASFVASFAAGAGSAAAAPLSALVEPPSQEHHIGKIIFAELVTPDLAAARAFYGQLFGWSFRELANGGTPYAEARLNGRLVAGLLYKPAPAIQRRQPAWLNFIAARDVDAVGKLAVQGGGRLLLAPHDLAGHGREAVLADPQGAVFAVLASASGDPADTLPEPGEWIWSSLITREPAAGAAFYQGLLDYEVFDPPADAPPGEQHLMLVSQDYLRASVNALPAGMRDARSHWLSYIRVEDAVKTSRRLLALGGRVLVEPRADHHGGKVAVVADPSGAAFGLLEWAVNDGDGVAR